MNWRGPTEAQRRAVLADLACPIMGGAADHELAADHDVPAAYVRELRDQIASDLEASDVTHRLEGIARLVGWTGSLRTLLLRLLDRAHVRAAERAEERQRAWQSEREDAA